MLPIRSKAFDDAVRSPIGIQTSTSSSSTPPVVPQTAVERLPASTQVLGTFELLTPILEHCDPHTLLCYAQRVNHTWKAVIDENRYIQHRLFFLPWGESDYLWLWGEVNPFLSSLSWKDGEEGREPGCEYDFGPAPQTDAGEESDDGLWNRDRDPTVYFELNWRRIETEPKFMREDASWRRMLPLQPPTREIWCIWRPDGQIFESNQARIITGNEEGGKRVGATYEDVLDWELDANCKRTKTFIRSQARFQAVVLICVQMGRIDTEEDLKDLSKSRLPR